MSRNRGRIRQSARIDEPPRVSSVRFHEGEVLWTLANTYPSLLLTLVELAQNGIDAEASAIFIGVDLKNRRVTVADNGNGANDTKFEQALASVGKGIKTRDKLGRFGRGLISPLNKCAHFTFTSKVHGRRPVRWTFRGNEIRRQHQEVSIPKEIISEMPRIVKLFRGYLTEEFDAKWSTIVHLEGVTKDKVISLVDLDELESQIRSKLGMAMRRHEVSIRVVLIDEHGVVGTRDIDPVMFTGEKFDPVSYVDADGAGQVEIELYRAPKLRGKRSGEVLFMELEGNYPVPLKEVARQLRGGQIEDLFTDVLSVLTSGFFEGIIRCENITLAPERTKFVYDDALISLFVLLESSWYEQVGQRQFEDEQERSRERRYQRLGLESQERLREFLPKAVWDKLRSAVKIGRLGDGHLDPTKGRMGGFEDARGLRTGQGGAGTPKTPRDEEEEPRRRQKEPKDRPGDMPTGSLGPDGRERQLVRGDSEGLWFEYSPLFANSHLWEFDLELGVITFNTKHPVWVSLDETNGRHTTKHEKQIMDLQEWLTLQILTLLLSYPDPGEFELHRAIIDDQVRPYSQMFILNKRR